MIQPGSSLVWDIFAVETPCLRSWFRTWMPGFGSTEVPKCQLAFGICITLEN